MKLSHRARLSAVAASSVGVLLAAVFTGVWLLSGKSERRATHAVLRPELAQLVDDLNEGLTKPDLAESTDSNPALALADFDAQGQPLQHKGPVQLPAVVGESEFVISKSSFVTIGVRSHGHILVAGLDWTARKAGLGRLAAILFLLWPPLVAIVAAVTWLAARATFRPLETLTRQAAGLGVSQIAGRLEIPDDAEFGAFVDHLNRFLDRLEDTVRREEQFASDAAHELRTPLTILQGHIETALLKPRDTAEYESALRVALSEAERLSRLVEALLRSALAGTAPADPLDLQRAVEQVQARWVDRFESQSVHLSVATEPGDAAILEEEIECVLDNVLENALRHSPAGTTCSIVMAAHEDSHSLAISDQGSGIAADLLPRVFQRFVRSDASRTREMGGFGIGLATCKRIVESRGGSIGVANRQDGGAEFTVTLPAVLRDGERGRRE